MKKRVLLIDDDFGLIQEFKEKLTDSEFLQISYSTTCVTEAIEIAKNNKDNIDIVIFDLLMPFFDGIYFLDKLTEYIDASKVIIMSEFFSEETFRYLTYYKIGSIFNKPINHLSLEKMIENYCFSKKKEDSYLNKLLHEIGIPSHLIGYSYIKEGINSMIRSQDEGIKLTNLYDRISEMFATNSSCVERAIRHAIETSWSRGNLEVIDDLFGYSISISKDKPSNIEFMKTISDRIKEKDYH